MCRSASENATKSFIAQRRRRWVQVFQIALFRIFNKPATWTRLCDHLGTPSYSALLKDRQPFLDAFEELISEGHKLANGSYKLQSPSKARAGEPEHVAKLRFIKNLMTGNLSIGTKSDAMRDDPNAGPLPKRLLEFVSGTLIPRDGASRAEAICQEIQAYDGFGAFLAFQ